MDTISLLSRFRRQSGDRATPPLWSDEEVIEYLNEGEDRAAIGARLLYDRETEAAAQVPLLVGVRDYRLHPAVFDVDTAALLRPDQTRRCPLDRADPDALHRYVERTQPTGWPREFAAIGDPRDGLGMSLRLDRAPTEAGGVLHLAVFRRPLTPLTVPVEGQPAAEPEIDARHHAALLDYALYRCYLTRDMEGDAGGRAERHKARFEEHFGLTPDAGVQRKQARHRARTVRAERW